MEQNKPRRRPKVKRFTAPRRAAFLGFYERTGNFAAAAKAVGIDRSTAEQRCKRDAQFALDCMAAKDEAARRLAGARDSSDGVADAEFEAIRRGRGGRPQIVATRKGKWCKSVEEVVLAVLRQSGNAAAAARAAGISEGTIWTRRRQWPAFRERMEEALEEAELVLAFRLATMGNVAVADEDAESGARPSTSLGTNDVPAVPFDADLALRFLKWRQQSRAGLAGRRGKFPAERPFEEVVESIMSKVEAIDRHENKRLLEEGWSQDEETGRMIPPGWVRKDPPSPEAPADGPGDEWRNGTGRNGDSC